LFNEPQKNDIISQHIYHGQLLPFDVMEKARFVSLFKECGAIQFGHFILTSGAESTYYIDIKRASTDPKILGIIAQEMKKYTKGCDMLAGMELGAVPLIVALSLKTQLPYAIVRKQQRDHGTGKKIEGQDVKGKKVLIIEDVTTSGGSVVATIQSIREAGGITNTVLVVVDRDSGAFEKMKSLDVTLIPLLSIHDILHQNDIVE
jgi:orotate phosphoribosyltransferase